MPKKKEEKKEFKNFAEFSYEGTTFSYTGRVYRPEEGKGKILKSAYVSITLNGVFTLKGCYLKETEESYLLSFPQYKTKDGYNPYVFLDKDFYESEEYDTLVDTIAAKMVELA